MYQPVRTVYCESAESWICEEFLFYENEMFARSFLKQRYTSLGIDKPDSAAFKNVQSFNAYIRQARAIFQSLNQRDLWVQPLLLYYGMMSFMKAWILTLDIHYPQNTSVLRHGLSTRKRKKEAHPFFQDEIRVQKEGLFPLAASLLGSPLLTGDSYTPPELIGMISDLQMSYQRIFHQDSLFPVIIQTARTIHSQGMTFRIPETILDRLHLTSTSFVQKLNQVIGFPLFNLMEQEQRDSFLTLIWHHPDVQHVDQWQHGFRHPWFYEDKKGDYYLWCGNNRPIQPISELLAQFMLLFSLSMICRYETPLWGEIIYTSTTEDAILIQQLLTLVQRKFPQLILQKLADEKQILVVR